MHANEVVAYLVNTGIGSFVFPPKIPKNHYRKCRKDDNNNNSCQV